MVTNVQVNQNRFQVAIHGTDLITTYMAFVAAFCISAIISGIVAAADKDTVTLYFFCHGCYMLPNVFGDLFQRLAAHYTDSDGFPVVQG